MGKKHKSVFDGKRRIGFQPVHLVVTREDEIVRVYVNGKKKASSDLTHFTMACWVDEHGNTRPG